MGKKEKKKGKGAEKTMAKTEKKWANKLKKDLEKRGEEDIEAILAEIEKEESKRNRVQEHISDQPSRRINFSFIPHPDKDELILHGGEYFDGKKTLIFSDLYIYNIIQNTWTLIQAPAGPPPRCGHQMVACSANKGQLWLFGGEFASSSQSQFYHYKDLWLYHMQEKKWQKINTIDSPSARSGHRMVYLKKQLFIFGGFHDNLRDYKYYNDMHCFNTDSYKWIKLSVVGTPPAPRSGCCMIGLSDGRILIYGGFSKEKIKKDSEKGKVYTDAFLFSPDKNDTTGIKYKWSSVKLGGIHFSPRCGMPLVPVPNNSIAYCFGGVFDIENETENDDDDLAQSNFYDDLFALDLDKLIWRTVSVSDKDKSADKKSSKEDVVKIDTDDSPASDVIETCKTMETTTISDDGVFTVTIGPTSSQNLSYESEKQQQEIKDDLPFRPHGRRNCGLAMKKGILYLYGGMYEHANKEITFRDFYSLDMKKLDKWKTLLEDNMDCAVTVESDESSDGGNEKNISDSDESLDDSDSEENV